MEIFQAQKCKRREAQKSLVSRFSCALGFRRSSARVSTANFENYPTIVRRIYTVKSVKAPIARFNMPLELLSYANEEVKFS